MKCFHNFLSYIFLDQFGFSQYRRNTALAVIAEASPFIENIHVDNGFGETTDGLNVKPDSFDSQKSENPFKVKPKDCALGGNISGIRRMNIVDEIPDAQNTQSGDNAKANKNLFEQSRVSQTFGNPFKVPEQQWPLVANISGVRPMSIVDRIASARNAQPKSDNNVKINKNPFEQSTVYQTFGNPVKSPEKQWPLVANIS